ncbi:MAG: hypothetical protein U0103_05980 [Candidatus Obscuribacterales bacterium]|jgi:hypothetical protein|nr:hypothetical protein [Cyanobacteria bacterium SZAS LIN-5]RTL39767.1 MAG: hypothetical protein EKK48_18010 [Candidatus Melainabacteria bacterium]
MALSRARIRKRRNKKGQGITEYGAILAFVALMVSLTFGFASGSLSKSVSAAFSVVRGNLDNLSTAAASSS